MAMTKEMFNDLIKVLKRKNKILLVLVIVLAVALVGMTAFAFSEFDIVVEQDESTTYNIEQNAETNGNDSAISQDDANIEIIEESDNSGWIVIVVIGVVVLAIIGVKYGESIKKNNNRKTEIQEDNDNEKA